MIVPLFGFALLALAAAADTSSVASSTRYTMHAAQLVPTPLASTANGRFEVDSRLVSATGEPASAGRINLTATLAPTSVVCNDGIFADAFE